MTLLYLAVGVSALFVVGEIGFTALPAARRFKRECWADLPLDWRIALLFLILVGTIGDVVFNWTRAAVIFRGFSKIMFSSRIQARVDAGKRDALTRRWVRVLNTGDPGPPPHIRLPADWQW